MLSTLIENFLYDAVGGKSKPLSPAIIKEFQESCGKALEKQFNEQMDWRIRMSGLGKPLCQQQLDKKGIKKEFQYNTIIKFLMGDLLEAVAIAVMRGAGVNIEKLQEPVSLKIGDIELKGTYDVKIDGKVWDIKSASPASFLSKFGEYGSYNKIKENDSFVKYCNMLNLEWKVAMLCNDIFQANKDKLSSVTPKSATCGVLVYVIKKKLQLKLPTKSDLSIKLNVCTPTINKVLQLLDS